MALEDLTGGSKYTSDLVVTNPTGSDSKSDGDGHLRGIKNAIANTWANITGAVTATHTELNLMDGVTATTAEINNLAGSTTGTVLTTGDEGTGNGIDADTVDGNEAAALLDRANHTGTQTLSTVSDAGTLAGVNSVSNNDIDWTFSNWSETYSSGQTALASGIYWILGAGSSQSVTVEVYQHNSTSWVELGTFASGDTPIFAVSAGGANQVRINNAAGADRTLYGFKFA